MRSWPLLLGACLVAAWSAGCASAVDGAQDWWGGEVARCTERAPRLFRVLRAAGSSTVREMELVDRAPEVVIDECSTRRIDQVDLEALDELSSECPLCSDGCQKMAHVLAEWAQGCGSEGHAAGIAAENAYRREIGRDGVLVTAAMRQWASCHLYELQNADGGVDRWFENWHLGRGSILAISWERSAAPCEPGL